MVRKILKWSWLAAAGCSRSPLAGLVAWNWEMVQRISWAG